MKFSDLMEQELFVNCDIRVQRWDYASNGMQDLYSNTAVGWDALEAEDW